MVLTAARHARRRVKIALAASLVLLVLSATYLTVTLGYELAEGGSSTYPGSASNVTAGNVTEYRYLIRAGSTLEYGFSIANRGPLTVRLTEVVGEVGWYGWYGTIEQVRMNDDIRRCCLPSDAVPFRPIDLRPGDHVFLWVTLRFPEELRATVPCATFWFDTQKVRFGVLGMPREQLVPIGPVIRATVQDGHGHPCVGPE